MGVGRVDGAGRGGERGLWNEGGAGRRGGGRKSGEKEVLSLDH